MDARVVASAERLCARAISWLAGARARLVLSAGIPAELVDATIFKALSELALAGWVVRREGAAGARTSRQAQQALDHVWEQFGEGDVLYRMQRRNPAATHVIETYSILHAAGYEHTALDKLAAHLVTLRSYAVPELVPNRRLALAAAIHRLGFTSYPGVTEYPAVTDLVADTWLGGTPEPWLLDTYNGYALTHTAFHLTDHGGRTDGLPRHLRGYLERWLPVWLDVYAESGFWDLLGELLIVRTYLGGLGADAGAWERFVAAQHDDGMVPNGINRPTADPQERVMTHYHPTVVAAIAGTLVASYALARP
jgi:hypothetical protein